MVEPHDKYASISLDQATKVATYVCENGYIPIVYKGNQERTCMKNESDGNWYWTGEPAEMTCAGAYIMYIHSSIDIRISNPIDYIIAI